MKSYEKEERLFCLLFCVLSVLFVTCRDLGGYEGDHLMGLTVLLVFLRLEIALDGDTVALLQEVEGSSVLVLAPHLDVEECALALVLTVNLLGTCDAEAEACY